MEKQTNVTQLLKNKNITEFMDKFINKKLFRDSKFEFTIKRYNNSENIKHKNFALLGATMDYYFRYKIAKNFKIEMSQLIAEKSLYLMKLYFFDFSIEEDNLIYGVILNIIKKYKSLNFNEKTFPFLCLGMVDSFYRTGYFDKYNFWLQVNQFTDYLKNKEVITPLIEDFYSVASSIDKLVFSTKYFKIHHPVYLSPDLTQTIGETLIKADADMFSYNVLWELKTTLNTNIPIKYIRQLLMYYWLTKRLEKEHKLFYFNIVNTRAKNFFTFRISDILNTEPRDFFLKFDSFMRKELKNAI